VGCVLMTACGDNDRAPTTPGPTQIDVSGRWAGDLTFQGATARMMWMLTQTGSAVTGPVVLALPSGTVLLNGVLNGTITGPSLAYAITVSPGGIPLQPACSGQLGGTMTVTQTATSAMNGNIAVTSSTCAIQFSSTTFIMTRM
jgi:hypothetical protein